MTTIEALETRIHNLEIAVTGVITLLQEATPFPYSESIGNVGRDLFESNRALGGMKSATMRTRSRNEESTHVDV